MIVQIVRFKSALPDQQISKIYEARAAQYREVKGLVQKYYLRFETGEHGAVYLWQSKEALHEFLESDLYRTIPTAYRVHGVPDTRSAELVLTLRPELERQKAEQA